VPTARFDAWIPPSSTRENFDSIPSLTPTSLPLPTPTSRPIPATGLVWGRNAAGVYLWASPEGKILTHLANGTEVKFLEERSSYGNQPWIKVIAPDGEGWLLQMQVFRESENPVAYIDVWDGTYLRDQPRGGIQQPLSRGTPIMSILERQATDGRIWARVEVVDGAIGWVAEDRLAVELPAGKKQD
jgi:hypothetical protein